MPDLKGSKTHQNLKDAFEGESTGNPRCRYFAKVADIEGYPEVAGKFRETAAGQTGREEGFEEISDWFETLAKAEKSRAGRFVKTLASIR